MAWQVSGFKRLPICLFRVAVLTSIVPRPYYALLLGANLNFVSDTKLLFFNNILASIVLKYIDAAARLHLLTSREGKISAVP
jgi:hypothetical protein